MSEQEHKNTWNGFTKLVLFGTIAVISLLVNCIYAALKNESSSLCSWKSKIVEKSAETSSMNFYA